MKKFNDFLQSNKQILIKNTLLLLSDQTNTHESTPDINWEEVIESFIDSFQKEVELYKSIPELFFNPLATDRPLTACGADEAAKFYRSGGKLELFAAVIKSIKTSFLEILTHYPDLDEYAAVCRYIHNGFDSLEMGIIKEWEKGSIQSSTHENLLKETSAIYESAFLNNHSIMLIIHPETGSIYDANPAACSFYGYKKEQLLNMTVSDINLLTDPEVKAVMKTAESRQQSVFNFRHILADGTIKDVEVSSGPISLGGESYLFSVIHDVTERMKTEKALAENEEHLRKFMDSVDEAILLFDESLNLNSTNKSANSILEDISSMIGDHISTIFDKYLNEYNLIEIFKAQTSHDQYVFQTRSRNSSSDIHLEIDAFQVGTGLGVSIRDITRQKAYETSLEFSAHHDSLTGLPNRTLFYDRLGQAIKKATRNESNLAVLFIDLDGFKAVNDQFGHETGDEVLQNIAESLRVGLRNSDTVARMGGDEFTVLLEKVNSSETAMKIAEKVLQSIEREIVRDSRRVYVTASIGISMFPNDSFEIEELIQVADKAMYLAKNNPNSHISFP